jgi:superfamily II RNA helicase
MSELPPPFDWSKRLQYNWYSERGLETFAHEVGPSLPFKLDRFQLECTARIMDGQDVLCLSATGDGKSALMYLASIARKGTITLAVCPTNFLESDLVRSVHKLHSV